MTRISRSSSLRSSRYQLQYADNLNKPAFVNRVESINRSRSLSNHTEHPSEHALRFYENYYHSIKELKKEFKDFYHNEQAMSKAITELDSDPEQFQAKMEQLIEKYNLTIKSLQSLDEAISTKNADIVQQTVSEHSALFENFGVNIADDGQLTFDTSVFQKNILSTTKEDAIFRTFAPLKAVIISAYRKLRSIRGPKTEATNKYDTKDTDYRGYIYEQKL